MNGAWFDDGDASEYCGMLITFSVRRKTRDDDTWVLTLPLVGGQSSQVQEFQAQDLEDAKMAACLRALKYLAHVSDDVVAAMKARRTP